MQNKINFLKYRYVFIIFSLVIIIGGIAYGLATGYVFDVDFKGGTSIQVQFNEAVSNNDIQNLVKEITGEIPIVQKLGADDTALKITTGVISNEQADSIVSALKEKYSNIEEPSVRNIQPSYGSELINSALLAICVSVVLILLYIGIRFKTLGFTAAVTAIIALIHDVLFIIAIYGIIKFPINSNFVAVILTIVGYSINDTIIVYDRIRENRRKITKSNDFKDTINLSLSQTVKRTVNTSITTVATIAIVYVFSYINNQDVLKQFSLPLMVGVIVGTYSSMCIATSLLYEFDKLVSKFKKKK